ncbi:tail fiber assembly protein [Citrobacter sp. Cpo035]|uniref:tail fiber assembly protein n=1 Tax=Citrobacter TaxID=544 RepID=UPI002577CB16|nr:tail fiber assembly protein [Citrobacter sp. Cpo035]MDM2913094.1 tail fiber assembly protein [Citrobacter sp. Cpo035]
MNKFYQGVFYPEALKEAYISAGTWPEYAVDVSDEVMSIYSQYPPKGKMLGTDNNGYPVWIDIPPLSPEELVAQAEQTQRELLTKAESEISWRQYAVDRNKSTAEEAADLIKWQDYRLELMRVNTSKPEWPTPPNIQAT